MQRSCNVATISNIPLALQPRCERPKRRANLAKRATSAAALTNPPRLPTNDSLSLSESPAQHLKDRRLVHRQQCPAVDADPVYRLSDGQLLMVAPHAYEVSDLMKQDGQSSTESTNPPGFPTFTFSAAGASAYQFGNFGTPAKQLHSFKLIQ
jgi:hypothetical protein